ncbi:MAG: hypothetical protein AB4372_32525 [Xenococcus sp. (in: cyanobacteria)]
MSQSNFKKGDRVKLKNDDFNSSIGTVIDVMPFKFNTESPPLITVQFPNSIHGVLDNELILVPEDKPDC